MRNIRFAVRVALMTVLVTSCARPNPGTTLSPENVQKELDSLRIQVKKLQADTGRQTVSGQMTDVSIPGRIRTCGTLSRKISTYGPINATASVLAGSSGVAAAFDDSNNREVYGIVTAVMAAFAAWARYKEARQVDRWNEFGCEFFFRSDPADPEFIEAYNEYVSALQRARLRALTGSLQPDSGAARTAKDSTGR